jgi:hypothetical protein
MRFIKFPIFLLMMIASLSAFADNNIDSYEVSGLRAYAGQKLSIYYVSGRPAGLGTPGQEISVNKVMAGPQTYTISSNGTVQTQRIVVPRDGWTSYNYVIFVVHRQPVHALTNIDWRAGNIVREEVRYLDESIVVDYSVQNQSFVFKSYKTSRELGGGVNISL